MIQSPVAYPIESAIITNRDGVRPIDIMTIEPFGKS